MMRKGGPARVDESPLIQKTCGENLFIVANGALAGKALEQCLGVLHPSQGVCRCYCGESPVNQFLSMVADAVPLAKPRVRCPGVVVRAALVRPCKIPSWLLGCLYFSHTEQEPEIYQVMAQRLLVDLIVLLCAKGRRLEPENVEIMAAKARGPYWHFVQHRIEQETGVVLRGLCLTGIEALSRLGIVNASDKVQLRRRALGIPGGFDNGMVKAMKDLYAELEGVCR